MIKLHNGDCIEVMNQLIEEGVKVDAVITDPPYNVSRPNNFQTMGSAARVGMDFGEWDKNFDLVSWINPMSKLLKENANVVIFNAWENLSAIKEACEKNNIMIKRCLVLSKSNPAPFNRDRMFVNDVEFALWGVYNSKRKPSKWIFNRVNPVEKCVIPTSVQSSKLHPTMKDLKVISKLVHLLSNENDIVLDCFLGSGTTGVACKQMNRNFIGIELDKKYFDIASKRVEETVENTFACEQPAIEETDEFKQQLAELNEEVDESSMFDYE